MGWSDPLFLPLSSSISNVLSNLKNWARTWINESLSSENTPSFVSVDPISTL
jgi:hypothetical protein